MSDLDSIFNEDWPDDHKSGIVAIIGHPNVGKSTLINRILGQKIAIVTPTPQTTRRQQLGIYTRDDVQILFVDTPGIHDPYHKLGEFMVKAAQSALQDVDVVLWIVDISQPPNDEDRHIASILERLKNTTVIMGMNKADKFPDEDLAKRGEPFLELLTPTEHHIISAQEGDNVDKMLESVISYLPLGPRYYPKDQLSEVNLRFIAAEIVREQVILQTHDEIPHAVAVGIDSFEERQNGTFHIHATIYVEKVSQKGIIIGSQGHMIKQLGIDSRNEMKRVFEHSVNLFLHVKVLKNWRSDARSMRQFGYYIDKDN